MKYIIVETKGLPIAILFDELLQHNEVAKADGSTISAGFCNVQGQVWGASVSLGLRSRKEDEVLIRESIKRTALG